MDNADAAILSTTLAAISALIATLASIGGPIYLKYLTEKGQRRRQADDWARQDVVAQRLEESARAAEKAAREIRQGTVDVARTAATTAEAAKVATEAITTKLIETSNKIDVVHTLVNSELSAQMQRRYDVMIELRALRAQDKNFDPIAAAALDLEIKLLKDVLHERTIKTTEAAKLQTAQAIVATASEASKKP